MINQRLSIGMARLYIRTPPLTINEDIGANHEELVIYVRDDFSHSEGEK